jgi:4-diphosphocytidyl-2-C-methyl-D-erythritol kinase
VSQTARVQAQAKINLFLRILSREPSGYHQLETLFQRISLTDVVTVRLDVAARSLDCAGPTTGPDGGPTPAPHLGPTEKNLAWRAAVAFCDVARWQVPFAIEIEKHIPVGGGLGGGSADGAAVLRALNALAPQPLGQDALNAIAFTLGADVPFLTTEMALALGTGRGEQLIPFAPLSARPLRLVLPGFGVASKDAFGWHADDRAGRAPTPIPHVPLIGALNWDMVAALAGNDLEGPVFTRHPELPGMLRTLAQSGATLARMTGSGSTLFAVYDAPPTDPPTFGDGVRVVDATTVQRVPPVAFL